MENIRLKKSATASTAISASAFAAAMLANSAMAYATGGTSNISTAMNSVFAILESIANGFQSGMLTIVAPIGIAVGLYFAARMLLAGDPKDVTTYRKRLITTAIIVAVAFALPGLIRVATQIGQLVESQL